MADARTVSGPHYQRAMDKLQRIAPNMTPGGAAPGATTPNTQHVLNPAGPIAGGRTTAGYAGPHNYAPAPQMGFAGGSAPRIQVPVPPPAAGPGMASLPPQVLAILSMLGGGQRPAPGLGAAAGAAGGMLGQLNNGGYGMAPPAGLSTQVENPGYGMVPPPGGAGLGQLNNGGYSMVPAAQGGLGQLNNGGYGMQQSPGQVQALLAMLSGGGSTWNRPGGGGGLTGNMPGNVPAWISPGGAQPGRYYY